MSEGGSRHACTDLRDRAQAEPSVILFVITGGFSSRNRCSTGLGHRHSLLDNQSLRTYFSWTDAGAQTRGICVWAVVKCFRLLFGYFKQPNVFPLVTSFYDLVIQQWRHRSLLHFLNSDENDDPTISLIPGLRRLTDVTLWPLLSRRDKPTVDWHEKAKATLWRQKKYGLFPLVVARATSTFTFQLVLRLSDYLLIYK